ncbi:hypothetical protein K458DRAFT_489246 [Lentithecium fluviatile CBS 122367]|uniref:Uncharacterized protein n=1 Tax=Lentithecium fluviatile CBS 122367 TaxID=1168545 RepID=A0A6G1ITG1_9PLEO|nr:hypothetical protein K458DRAFT_489246 [Lentithecium fluviatile CBS 122367]
MATASPLDVANEGPVSTAVTTRALISTVTVNYTTVYSEISNNPPRSSNISTSISISTLASNLSPGSVTNPTPGGTGPPTKCFSTGNSSTTFFGTAGSSSSTRVTPTSPGDNHNSTFESQGPSPALSNSTPGQSSMSLTDNVSPSSSFSNAQSMASTSSVDNAPNGTTPFGGTITTTFLSISSSSKNITLSSTSLSTGSAWTSTNSLRTSESPILPISTSSSTSSLTAGTTSTIAPPPSITTSYSDEEINSYFSMTSWDDYLITSTITTDTAISASQTSNSDWKKSFWLRTTINGQPTDLPVVHCGCICKGTCGGDDEDDDDAAALWIIYFNVPKVPNIQISLPKLPDFHLAGCIRIKIPIINIEVPLGKCPPVSDNGDHGHVDPDDPERVNKEPDPNNTDDPNEPEILTSRTSTSSSSSCSGAVVTDSLTQIVCPSGSASNCQTTVETSTRSGCSITGTMSATKTINSCSEGVVTDSLTKVSCGATSTPCSTTVQTSTRSGCSLTGTASVTVTSSAAACARRVWPTSFGPGVGYSAPGFTYGTYSPPAIFGSPTMSFSSMNSSGSSPSTGTSTNYHLSTVSSTATSASRSSSATETSQIPTSMTTESAVSTPSSNPLPDNTCFILDKNHGDIPGCNTGYEVLENDKDFIIKCDAIHNQVTVHAALSGKWEFTYGDQKWVTGDLNICDIEDMPEGDKPLYVPY